jgi:hypothetical protein
MNCIPGIEVTFLVLIRIFSKCDCNTEKKQGNQHLQLWTKQAYIVFHKLSVDSISQGQQHKITDWIEGWSYKNGYTAASVKYRRDDDSNGEEFGVGDMDIPTVDAQQMEIFNWVKSWGAMKRSAQNTTMNIHCQVAPMPKKIVWDARNPH